MIRSSIDGLDFARAMVQGWKFGFSGGGFRGSINLLQSIVKCMTSAKRPNGGRSAIGAQYIVFFLSWAGIPLLQVQSILRPVHEDFTHLRIPPVQSHRASPRINYPTPLRQVYMAGTLIHGSLFFPSYGGHVYRVGIGHFPTDFVYCRCEL